MIVIVNNFFVSNIHIVDEIVSVALVTDIVSSRVVTLNRKVLTRNVRVVTVQKAVTMIVAPSIEYNRLLAFNDHA